MVLGSYRRLFKTDYAKEYQALIDKLATSINYSFDSIYQALNNNITFADNMTSSIVTFTVTVGNSSTPSTTQFVTDLSGNKSSTQIVSTNTGVPVTTTKFTLPTYQSTVNGLIVIDCYETASGKPPISAPFVAYTQNQSTIIVNNVMGLTPKVNYTVVVLVVT